MVNYPNKKKTQPLTLMEENLIKHDTSRRGYSLESALNQSNQYYLAHDKAIIHKKPTPIQIVKVDYPRRSAAKIVEAYFKIPSTTDYNGIYRGKYIDFEAKECSKNSFPFRNIHPHQIDHLEAVEKHGGIAFLMIAFTQKNEVYLIDAKYVVDKFRHAKRQSLLYENIKKNGYLVKQGYMPELDYLSVVDEVYFKEDENLGKRNQE